MSTSSEGMSSWVINFCAMTGHEYFTEVTDEFIGDDFNLTGLQAIVPCYKEALELILDVDPASDWEEELESALEDDSDLMGDDLNPDDDDYWLQREELRRYRNMALLEANARLLYGLIHQRFIVSRQGLSQMFDKFEQRDFGHCPRVLCNQAPVLPVGCYDEPSQDTVKLFCPCCLDIYNPPNSRFHEVDGAYFGTTFAYFFFIQFPDISLSWNLDPLGLKETHPVYGMLPSERLAMSLISDDDYDECDDYDGEDDEDEDDGKEDGKLKSKDLDPRSHSKVSCIVTDDLATIQRKNKAYLNGLPARNQFSSLGPGKTYIPRIYGFRVSELAKTGPRMAWLRMRPRNLHDLDEWGNYHAERSKKLRAEAQQRAGTGTNADNEEAKLPHQSKKGQRSITPTHTSPLVKDARQQVDGQEVKGQAVAGGEEAMQAVHVEAPHEAKHEAGQEDIQAQNPSGVADTEIVMQDVKSTDLDCEMAADDGKSQPSGQKRQSSQSNSNNKNMEEEREEGEEEEKKQHGDAEEEDAQSNIELPDRAETEPMQTDTDKAPNTNVAESSTDKAVPVAPENRKKAAMRPRRSTTRQAGLEAEANTGASVV